MSAPHLRGVDLICDLPECISASVCSSWLQLKYLVFLDSAYCCREKRTLYLELLGSAALILESEVICQKVQHMSWMCQRRIQVSYLEISGSFYPGSGVFFQTSGKTIRKLVLHGISECYWSTLGKYCIKVVELELIRCTLGERPLTFISQCAFLRCLQLQSCPSDGSSSDYNLAPCKSLLFIEIASSRADINVNYFLRVFQLVTAAVEVISVETPNFNIQSELATPISRLST